MARILIVEDEAKLAAVLVDYLNQAGFECDVVADGALAMSVFHSGEYAAVLLDLMLPHVDGLALCRLIRQHSSVPVIMTTARVAEIDRLIGLEIGADDYICKPYSPREVVARVRAMIRRAEEYAGSARSSGAASAADLQGRLKLDDERLEAELNGQRVELTRVEFDLLFALLARPGVILSRERLMSAIYSDHRVVSDRTIDSHIKKLRRKLAPLANAGQSVESVYGAGYRYVAPQPHKQ